MYRAQFVLLVLVALSGCASITTPSHDRVILDAPEGTFGHYANGEPISIYQDTEKRYFYANGGYDEAVTFYYAGHVRRVELAKSANPWLIGNILNYGLGFVLDDASNAWCTYGPVTVFAEPLADHPDSLSIQNPSHDGWLHDPHRPYLVLTGGLGFGSGLQGEWGLGIGYRRAIELLYRQVGVLDVSFAPSVSLDYTGTVASNVLELRGYPLGGLFFEAGWGHVNLSADTNKNQASNVNFLNYPPWSTNFGELVAGVGWAGELSYVELQYSRGLSEYHYFDLSPNRLTGLSVTYGLHFRL